MVCVREKAFSQLHAQTWCQVQHMQLSNEHVSLRYSAGPTSYSVVSDNRQQTTHEKRHNQQCHMRIGTHRSLSQSCSKHTVAPMSNGVVPLSYHPYLIEINEVVVKVKEMTGTYTSMSEKKSPHCPTMMLWAFLKSCCSSCGKRQMSEIRHQWVR